MGNGTSSIAALKIPFQPDFWYRARVNVEVPQSALLKVARWVIPVVRLSAQTSWTNWHRSFSSLPISLTEGSNPDINGFLRFSSIQDAVPLDGKDLFTFRIAAKRRLGEDAVVSVGYAHQNSPVPSSTLPPMTAAIIGNTLAAGFGRRFGRVQMNFKGTLPALIPEALEIEPSQGYRSWRTRERWNLTRAWQRDGRGANTA